MMPVARFMVRAVPTDALYGSLVDAWFRCRNRVFHRAEAPEDWQIRLYAPERDLLAKRSWFCPIDPLGPDEERVRRLSARLEKRPLAVRTAGAAELGYGLLGYKGQIFIARFNLFLVDAVVRLETSGEYPPGEDDTTVLAAARVLQGGLPNSGETVEWALAALAGFGVHAPDYPFDDFPEAPADFRALPCRPAAGRVGRP